MRFSLTKMPIHPRLRGCRQNSAQPVITADSAENRALSLVAQLLLLLLLGLLVVPVAR